MAGTGDAAVPGMMSSSTLRLVLVGLVAATAACGEDTPGSELPGPDPSGDADPQLGPAGDGVPVHQTFATHLVLRTTLGLGGRGAGVLCPDPQTIEIGVTALVHRTREGDRVREESTLCAVQLPRFTVSAHGAIGGCDQTREAELAPGFDLDAIAPGSVLEAPSPDAGDALPMAFILGAQLDDPFGDALPTWREADRLRDDDGDGDPGVTFVANGLPVLDDGAELYGSLRVLITPRGDGRADAGMALSLVGSDAGLSGRTLEVISPRFDGGLEVELDRAVVGDDATCADLRDDEPLW